MKFYDLKIQNHLLKGGKIRNNTYEGSYVIYIGDDCVIKKDNNEDYILKGQDLSSDKWEIVETKYNWDKIMQDRILCVFSDFENFRAFNISILINVNYKNNTYKTNEGLIYKYCKHCGKINMNENIKKQNKTCCIINCCFRKEYNKNDE